MPIQVESHLNLHGLYLLTINITRNFAMNTRLIHQLYFQAHFLILTTIINNKDTFQHHH